MLDVGCGQGDSSLPGWIGLDGDHRALVRARGDYGVVGVVADAEQAWPLVDRSVDAVVLFDILEHVPDPRWLLSEAARVLRGAGWLLVALPNAAHAVNRATAVLGRTTDFTDAYHRQGSPLSDHLHRFSVASGARLLEEAGYRVERRHEYFPTEFSEGRWKALSGVARAVAASGLHHRLPNLLAYELFYVCRREL